MLTGPTRTGYLVWVMLNPSKAGATRNDATINRIDAFTARHHFTRFDVVNLFSLIATDPRPLLHHPDPVGEGNDEMIARVVSEPRARVGRGGPGPRGGRARGRGGGARGSPPAPRRRPGAAPPAGGGAVVSRRAARGRLAPPPAVLPRRAAAAPGPLPGSEHTMTAVK